LTCDLDGWTLDWTAMVTTPGNSATWSTEWFELSWPCNTANYRCGAAQASGEFTITVPASLQSLLGGPYSYSLTADAAACVPDALCTLYAGTVDGCREVAYTFINTIPTCCTGDEGCPADQNRWTIEWDRTNKFACCNNADDCNDPDGDIFSACTDDTNFGGLVTDIATCWDSARLDWWDNLYCNDENNLFELQATCFNANGEYTGSTGETCTYGLTCSDEVKTVLNDFGACACAAVTNNPAPNGFYDLDVMDWLFSEYWKQWCPGLVFPCHDGEYGGLMQVYWYVYWRFRLALAADAITDAVRAQIITAVAAAAGVDEALIEVNIVVTTSENAARRLQTDETVVEVSIKTQTEEDAGTMQENMNSNGEQQISDETGSAATFEESEIDSQEESATSAGATPLALVALLVAAVAALLQ